MHFQLPKAQQVTGIPSSQLRRDPALLPLAAPQSPGLFPWWVILQTNSKAFTAKTSCVRRRYREFVWLRRQLQKNAGLV